MSAISCEFDEVEAELFDRRTRPVAVALEEASNARPRDEMAREGEVERRQRDGSIPDDLRRDTSLPEENDRTEDRIGENSEKELLGVVAAHHRLNGESVDLSARRESLDAPTDVERGTASPIGLLDRGSPRRHPSCGGCRERPP